MIIYTDNTSCAEKFLPREEIAWQRTRVLHDNPVSPLIDRIFETGDLFASEISGEKSWSYLLIAKSSTESQYDILIELGRNNIPLPHGILCLAGEGRKFHGFRGRHWDSPQGNIYLSAHFAPKMPVENYGVGFMILAAVSVIDAIGEIPGVSHKASIKWVNDILINGAKVCGVLAHTMAEADVVTNAVIGIGLNVETVPQTEPTIFVPRATSLKELVAGKNPVTRAMLFQSLVKSIYKNYLILVGGGFKQLLNRYRESSNVIGRELVIYDESGDDFPPVIAEGRVVAIGENLELYLEDKKEPVKRGRLAFK
jgi:BirA family biotin operon repressor/biotin-[acetyl-CoA-carboxylase] ligase